MATVAEINSLDFSITVSGYTKDALFSHFEYQVYETGDDPEDHPIYRAPGLGSGPYTIYVERSFRTSVGDNWTTRVRVVNVDGQASDWTVNSGSDASPTDVSVAQGDPQYAETDYMIRDGSRAWLGTQDLAGFGITSNDADAPFATIGRVKIGNVGVADVAGFSHRDQHTSAGYALLQTAVGATALNAAAGQPVDIRIGGSSVVNVAGTTMTIPAGKTLAILGTIDETGATVVGRSFPSHGLTEHDDVDVPSPTLQDVLLYTGGEFGWTDEPTGVLDVSGNGISITSSTRRLIGGGATISLDIGTGAAQVAAGDHGHTEADISDLDHYTNADLDSYLGGVVRDGAGGDYVISEAGVTKRRLPGDVLTDIGAAAASALTSHTGDTGNPHSVTASQVGAPPTGRTLTMTGTANQVNIAGGTQSLAANRVWTFSLPQNIHVGADVQFNSVTVDDLSGLGFEQSSITSWLRMPVHTVQRVWNLPNQDGTVLVGVGGLPLFASGGLVSHSSAAGHKHIPSGGAAGQVLVYGGSSGVASWGAAPPAESIDDIGDVEVLTPSTDDLLAYVGGETGWQNQATGAISGTANQVNVSATRKVLGGALTLSLPQDIHTGADLLTSTHGLTGTPVDPGVDTRVNIGKSGGPNFRVQTNYGTLDMGPANTGWAHFGTSTPGFWFNKKVATDGSFQLYNAGGGSQHGFITGASLTAERTWTFPDATGTVALTSDLSSYLPLAGGTLSGELNLGDNNIKQVQSIYLTNQEPGGWTPNSLTQGRIGFDVSDGLFIDPSTAAWGAYPTADAVYRILDTGMTQGGTYITITDGGSANPVTVDVDISAMDSHNDARYAPYNPGSLSGTLASFVARNDVGGWGTRTPTQVLGDIGAVPTSRNLTAGNGLTGGGTLAADRTFHVGAGDGISVTADAVAVDFNNVAHREYRSATITTPGWYRIAHDGPTADGQTGGDGAEGIFTVHVSEGGRHSSVTFSANYNYRNTASSPSLVLLNASDYSNAYFISKIRVVAGDTYEGAAVEVYINPSSSMTAKVHLENDGPSQFNWTTDNFTTGNIWTGAVATQLDVSDNKMQMGGSVGGGNNEWYIDQSGLFRGRLDMSDAVGGTLPVARGGTGKTSITSGHLVYGNGTGALNEVDDAGNTDGDFIAWNDAGYPEWRDPSTMPVGSHALNDHTNVSGTPTTNDLLKWNGSGWVPGSAPPPDMPLGDLNNVNDDTKSTNDFLRYDGSDWVDTAIAASHVQSGTFANARISQSSVTQHEAALSIGAGQITGTLGETHGGTGTGSYTKGDILYSNGSNNLSKLAIGPGGFVLTVDDADGVPYWAESGGGGADKYDDAEVLRAWRDRKDPSFTPDPEWIADGLFKFGPSGWYSPHNKLMSLVIGASYQNKDLIEESVLALSTENMQLKDQVASLEEKLADVVGRVEALEKAA